jgi:tetratricopeptide (TPR) repeat protein
VISAFFNFHKIILVLVVVFWYQSLPAQDEALINSQDQAFNLIFQDPEKAIVLIDSLIEQYQFDKTHVQGKNLSNKGVYYGVQNKLDSSLFYFQKALAVTETTHAFYPKLLNNIAIVQKKKGDYQAALDTLVNALEVANIENNTDSKVLIYSELSSVYRGLSKYDLAVENSLKLLELEQSKSEPNQKVIAFEKQKLGNLYNALKNSEFAAEIYKEILPYFEASPYTDSKIATYINYASALIALDQTEQGLLFLNKAKSNLDNFNNEELYAFYLVTLANYYIKQKQTERAGRSFEEALLLYQAHKDNYVKTLNQYLVFLYNHQNYEAILDYHQKFSNINNFQIGARDLLQHYTILAQTNEHLGYYREATGFYQKTIQLKDSLEKEGSYALAKSLQAKYQNEIILQKNINLQEKIQSEKRKQWAIVGFSLAVLSFLMSLSVSYWLKLRNKNKLTRSLEIQLKAEQELLQFKECLIDQQKQELLSKSLENNSLTKLVSKITDKISDLDSQTATQIEDLKRGLSPYHELNKLKFEFDRLYPHFKEEILKNFPALSKNDILFLSFMKLKFTLKEIATILGITHQSVISKKYRIMKKMKLNRDIDLYDFIEYYNANFINTKQ